jgi:hypothetical protein
MERGQHVFAMEKIQSFERSAERGAASTFK